jgi:ATP-dependent DNA helicase RecQ
VVLEALAAADRRFGLGIVKQVLRGSRARKLVTAGLDRGEAHGALAGLSAAAVDALLEEARAEGHFETSPGPYPVVRLTEEGRLRVGPGG